MAKALNEARNRRENIDILRIVGKNIPDLPGMGRDYIIIPMFRIGIPHLSLTCLVAASLLASCIDRSNPFDPLNAGGQAGANIRAEKQARLDSLTAGEAAYAAQVSGFSGSFAADSSANAERVKANAALRGRNTAIRSANAGVETANAKAVPDSLRHKEALALLDTLRAYGPYAGFQSVRTSVQVRTANLARFMADANAEHTPTVPYPSAYADSVLRPFALDTLACFRLQIRIDSGNAAVADSNKAVRAYDALRVADNAVVQLYNDSVDFVKRTQNQHIITKPDSLQGITFVAKAGDSLLIGAGRYPVDLRFTNSGTPDSPIVVRGYPGLRTLFVPAIDKNTGKPSNSTLILSGRSYIRFEDLEFRGGAISGVKLENGCRNIAFRRCVFDSSAQFGLEVIDSDVDLLDCRLLANGKGARLQGQEQMDYRVHLYNVLVAGNKGHGLECVTPWGEILNTTIADNDGEGIRVNSPRRALTIANTIVASNGGIGIFREAENGFQDLFQVKESDVWNNNLTGTVRINWGLQALDSTRAEALKNAALDVDPVFNDASRFDYGLNPASLLAGYEKQPLPVIIGYRP